MGYVLERKPVVLGERVESWRERETKADAQVLGLSS